MIVSVPEFSYQYLYSTFSIVLLSEWKPPRVLTVKTKNIKRGHPYPPRVRAGAGSTQHTAQDNVTAERRNTYKRHNSDRLAGVVSWDKTSLLR